ncbi:TetR family transcriptional regulator [Paracoccus sp. 1_MG-2023]|uniref:TetR/AcrR family transcriptional regulator n=1 Tax=unclassified Paracoccus (in: a-proteobacteria) TaxID=2688777 RepID=UPI00209187F4|nr:MULTISPECIES: TetR/AcrR family transcriptional regulator [unclassified Paracoccus (in: a-proteobacteria)]MDO6667427.1 TetR family transcriptional regulator [Paracoccus sp. 1_MG-2023]
MIRIAAGLERCFAARGFAEPSVEDLRAAAEVSLRTLYKYTPSRRDMVHAAMENRHRRYMARVLDDLPEGAAALDVLLDRVAGWMRDEASHGCLFHAAVAAAPDDPALHDLLTRHKAELAERAAAATGLVGHEIALTLIVEGLTQSWSLHGAYALKAAKSLGACLRQG